MVAKVEKANGLDSKIDCFVLYQRNGKWREEFGIVTLVTRASFFKS
jgi:hypothetical protein